MKHALRAFFKICYFWYTAPSMSRLDDPIEFILGSLKSPNRKAVVKAPLRYLPGMWVNSNNERSHLFPRFFSYSTPGLFNHNEIKSLRKDIKKLREKSLVTDKKEKYPNSSDFKREMARRAKKVIFQHLEKQVRDIDWVGRVYFRNRKLSGYLAGLFHKVSIKYLDDNTTEYSKNSPGWLVY